MSDYYTMDVVKHKAERSMALFDQVPPSLKALLLEWAIPDEVVRNILSYLQVGNTVLVNLPNGKQWVLRP